MSKIPRLSVSGKLPRPSISSTNKPLHPLKSNIPRPSLSKSKIPITSSQPQKQLKQSKYFKIAPKKSVLTERQLPDKYISKIHKIKSKYLEYLFSYTEKISQEYFKDEYHRLFFPPGLVQAKNTQVSKKEETSISRIPIRREQPKFSKSVGQAIDLLNDLMENNEKELLAMTDFCLLYPAMILSISEGEKCLTSTLSFVCRFLNLQFPERIGETNVLFSALFSVQNHSLNIKDLQKQALALLIPHNEMLLNRIEVGAIAEDIQTKEICKSVLQSLKMKNGSKDQSENEYSDSFAASGDIKLSNVTDAHTAAQILFNMITADDIGDKEEFMYGAILAMNHFPESMVLTAGCLCIQKHLNEVSPIEPCILGELVFLIFFILGFDSEADLDTKTAANNLLDELMATRDQNNLIAAACWCVNFLDNESCDQMVESFEKNGFSKEDMEDLKTVVAMHRGELDDPNATQLDNSIKKLLNPITMYGEAEKVITRTNDFSEYPEYMRIFLQRYYFLRMKETPVGINSEELKTAEDIIESCEQITVDDLTGDGCFAPQTVRTELTQIRETQDDIDTLLSL